MLVISDAPQTRLKRLSSSSNNGTNIQSMAKILTSHPVIISSHPLLLLNKGFLDVGSDDKESACNAGDLGAIPGSARSPEEGKGHPLQYSCLENSMDRGAWQATVHGVQKSRT